MLGILKTISVLMLAFSGLTNVQADELDDFWAEASRTVAVGDFEGYKATFHPDAVFVSGLKEVSYPISAAFARWKKGFDDTAAGKMKAGVEFRFSSTFKDEETAHQNGMFRYYFSDKDGNIVSDYMHFSALLVKKGGWKVIMEYQKSRGSAKEWDALKGSAVEKDS